MLKKSKTTLIVSIFLMTILFIIKTLVVIDLIESSHLIRVSEYIFFVSSIPLFLLLVRDLIKKEIEIRNRMNAINKSNAVIEFHLDGNIIYANDLFLIEKYGIHSRMEIIFQEK
jgi:hypothetical protein